MPQRISLHLSLRPWWQDHSFAGRAVLPAVETMLLLAQAAATLRPELDLRLMEQATFAKFLAIPPDLAGLDALVEWHTDKDGALEIKLLSRIQGKPISRVQEHGGLCFPGQPPPDQPSPAVAPPPWSGPLIAIPAEKIYQELVPFGPSYRSLQGTLHLSDTEARGALLAPVLPVSSAMAGVLGSPFPLDGAMHAACVLGQRLVDFVPFPVGIARRRIICPTHPGGHYSTRVQLTRHIPEELVFDLVIDDTNGQICETVTGLRMRDVSGGRIKPPSWIK
ncbi:MAG: hypothetical protein BWK76_23890 [Desulfobulbaceae bacterium A2]|nr:MAG: hypothetical protein BWK76_23890 [Desulfobulbaceae bacterium A2]